MSLLAMKGLSKSFPGVMALQDVDLEVDSGEIHALVGENGAGKSTLIKVLGGAVVPDRGEVWLEGEPLPVGEPLESRRRGVSIIYQEFTLVGELSAAENIFLGRERGGLFLNQPEMRRRAQELLDSLGAHVDATRPVRLLSVAQQQMVEIARALLERSKLLVLDEPSATLTNAEVHRLFTVLKDLRKQGLGIVYISHRLEEIFEIADRVSVLRDGKKIETIPVTSVDRPSLIRSMVGRDLSEEFPPRQPKIERAVIEVRHLSAPPFFWDVSFTVGRGEILGVSGLVGAGRTSVGLALLGAIPFKGEVLFEGRPVHFRHPREAMDEGLAYVTEDRKDRGIFPLLAALTNITISRLEAFSRFGVLSLTREAKAADATAKEFDVRAASLSQPAGTLSGGNQQKLLLARNLLAPCKLLILDEPTRGIDVGAKSEIYRLMNRLTSAGLAILMISSELPEVFGMSDRILVVHAGVTRGVLGRAEATPDRVMDLATGG